MTNGNMLIGEFAKLSGCKVETIRYYERIGVLPTPARSGRYRHYHQRDVERMAFVRRARTFGFTLAETRALIALSGPDAARPCEQARAVAARHLATVRARIADLKAMEETLAGAVSECRGQDSKICPVIDVLSQAPADAAQFA